ncbi:Serine--pyruvate aminotransferase [Toxocara canis]|uniref:alanine--glyoxylate transaminase n=1 Tax=Toxocara canis TaxID=6265 RepID=A0A0B2VKZ5_TOXCA|nr:Serine--pyruvate aminotransferase [Toxocara canis]
MECALINLLERGDKLLVLESGIWGTRAADLGDRLGLSVVKVTSPLGEPVVLDAIKEAIEKHHPKVVFVCHGESSTGVCQPLEGIGPLCHKHGALFLVDTVASLGGAPFYADKSEVDCVYSATQKVLNAPPGMSPISFSARAVESMRARHQRIASFYFDAFEIGNYWGCFDEPRRYHHTAPISTVYALHAALSALVKEGLQASVDRHRANANLFYKLLEEANLRNFIAKTEWRLPCLTTICVPDGVKWNVVQADMLMKGIEIAGGLGPTVGKVWRVGTFGANCTRENIERVVSELRKSIEVAQR